MTNNRGIDDGRDIDREFLSSLYERIVSNEIRMKGGEDDPKAAAAGAAKDAAR